MSGLVHGLGGGPCPGGGGVPHGSRPLGLLGAGPGAWAAPGPGLGASIASLGVSLLLLSGPGASLHNLYVVILLRRA